MPARTMQRHCAVFRDSALLAEGVKHMDQVYASGEPFVGTGVKAMIQTTPGADLEERWSLFCHSLFASNQFIYLN